MCLAGRMKCGTHLLGTGVARKSTLLCNGRVQSSNLAENKVSALHLGLVQARSGRVLWGWLGMHLRCGRGVWQHRRDPTYPVRYGDGESLGWRCRDAGIVESRVSTDAMRLQLGVRDTGLGVRVVGCEGG
jgi:hypothetical protein